MPYKRVIFDKDKTKIKKLLQNGNSYESIAKIYKVSKSRIGQFAKSFDLQRNDLTKMNRVAREKQRDIKLRNRLNKFGISWDDRSFLNTKLFKSCNSKFNIKKYYANRMKIPFTIEFKDITWNNICPILGIDLDYFGERSNDNLASFDRIDPNLGYVKGNVEIISYKANRIKNNGTLSDFRKMIDYLESKQNG